MINNFYNFIDQELQKALPLSGKKNSTGKTPGNNPCKIRQAFPSAPISGKPRLINILALPLSLEMDDLLEEQLIELRDQILSKGHILVVISEEERAGLLADMGSFIEGHLFINSPDFLWIVCSRDQDYKTTMDWEIFEDVNKILQDLRKGILYYDGPTAGLQQVNLELMQDKCPNCGKPMTTVTGLVFPDIQLKRWDNEDWLYYNQLLSLAELKGENARSVQQFVALLRKVDAAITPIRKRYDPAEQASYLAATCPHCKALRDDFEVSDYRVQYLHSLDSRITGHLKYYSISLRIGQELINSIMDGFECCDHTCTNGWKRK